MLYNCHVLHREIKRNYCLGRQDLDSQNILILVIRLKLVYISYISDSTIIMWLLGNPDFSW